MVIVFNSGRIPDLWKSQEQHKERNQREGAELRVGSGR